MNLVWNIILNDINLRGWLNYTFLLLVNWLQKVVNYFDRSNRFNFLLLILVFFKRLVLNGLVDLREIIFTFRIAVVEACRHLL